MNRTGRKPKVMLAMSELFTLLPAEEEHRHIEFAKIAEGEGIEGLFVSEHVVMGPSAGSLGRPDNRRQFVMPGMRDPRDALAQPADKALAAMAGRDQSTIRIISAALIAPLRHPITLAKDLATMDLISERPLHWVMPTVSWHTEEYQSMQVDFAPRVAAGWKNIWRSGRRCGRTRPPPMTVSSGSSRIRSFRPSPTAAA